MRCYIIKNVPMQSTTHFDRAATVLSLSCIVHCVALPFFAATLPFVAALAEAEWLHWLFTILAILASSPVILFAPSARALTFLVPAISGIGLIIGALFAESVGIDETPPTIIGGLLLAAAHIHRLFNHK